MTRRIPAPLPWLAGLLALYLVAPLVAGVQQASLADWNSVDTTALLDASAVSLASATTATLIMALGGIPLGYLLARLSGRAIDVLGFVVQLPLALPPLASGILLLFLFGYSAPLGRLTEGALTDSFVGIVLAEAFVAAPFLIIAARSAFASIDPVLEGVGATLGRSPLDVFLHVTLPIAWPSLLSGMLLAWLRAFGEFGATVMVAYHPYSLPVYTYVAFGAQGLPAMLPILLPTLAFALGIMALSNATVGRSKGPRSGRARVNRLAIPKRRSTAAQAAADAAAAVDVTLRLEKRLGSFHLDIAWAPRARRLAILGASGSGKSLTLKLIAGLEQSDRGSVRLGGREVSVLHPAARAIAYVPQNYGLFPNLSVIEQLRFPVGADPARARYWIDRLGLEGLEERHPAALSLGQQQRVALARALVRPADLLLLDEPFSALDAPLRAQLRREMLALQQEVRATTILVTHDPLEAALLADEVLVMESGRVLQSGPTCDVFRRPANATVAALLGSENFSRGVVVDENKIEIGGGMIVTVSGPPLHTGDRMGWSFSPVHARIGPDGALEGTLESTAVVGLDRQITVRVGHTAVRLMGGPNGLAPGDRCRFDIDPESVRVWPSDETGDSTILTSAA